MATNTNQQIPDPIKIVEPLFVTTFEDDTSPYVVGLCNDGIEREYEDDELTAAIRGEGKLPEAYWGIQWDICIGDDEGFYYEPDYETRNELVAEAS